jgi:hypothetical protein
MLMFLVEHGRLTGRNATDYGARFIWRGSCEGTGRSCLGRRGGTGAVPRGTGLLDHGRYFDLIVVDAEAAFHWVRRYDHALLEDRAAFDFFAYFMTESGSDGFSQHFERAHNPV